MQKKQQVVYLLGQMTGVPGWNFSEFEKAERYLTTAGYKVINPAKNAPHTHRDWGWYILRSLAKIWYHRPDLVLLLSGPGHDWRKSDGVAVERAFAKHYNIPEEELILFK